MSGRPAELTISAVADQTEVSEAVLRAWEHRHGFPVPSRLPSGHRRYAAEQVEQIRQVVRDRGAGLSLEAAIAAARSRAARSESSIFAGLRRRWSDLPTHELSTRGMLAISRAIEDECCAEAERPLLIGCFQHERSYRRSEARWRELARTAAATYVFADFRADRIRKRGPVELALPDDAHLVREWAVVCHAPDAAGCLVGFERPGRRGAARTFEAVWSVDPAVVADAAVIGATLARRPGLAVEVPVRRSGGVDPAVIVRRATTVTNRIVAYLDA